VSAPRLTSDLTSDRTRGMLVYRGWQISFDMPPIPYRGADWQAVHPDYDASYEGHEDGWVSNGLSVTAGTYQDLLIEIDCAQDDLECGL
jgi:hypothetical protein